MSTASSTRTARLFRRIGIRLRVVGYVQSAPAAPAGRPRLRTRRNARAGLFWFAVMVAFIHAAVAFAMDVAWPQLRDPEYGRRVVSLHQRVAEHPGRPLMLVIGSSRTAMGVRPGAWEAARPGTPGDPLVFNVGTVGAGPVQQLLTVRRLFADGVRPAVVLLEYWPPLLYQNGQFSEVNRIDPRRLRWADGPVIRDYFPSPDETSRQMWASRLSVLSDNRQRLMAQVDPELFPRQRHAGGEWAELDGWGWLPGMDPAPDDVATRRKLTDHQRPAYRDCFSQYAIQPNSDRALRESFALVRQHGVRVGLLYLPESAEFQSWYPPGVKAVASDHLRALCRECDVPLIDTRDWMDDRYLVDGFHLSRIGAGLFTPRLAPAISATFPASGRRP